MVELDRKVMQNIIAKNIANLLDNGSYVNLGVGIPTRVSNYISPEQNITLHAENGLLGTADPVKEITEETNTNIIDSGGVVTNYNKGASFFDSSLSFGIIRGGRLDATVLGTMEVDQEGNIANYVIPGKLVTGMGGAMDLCVGARQVIVATYHTNKGTPKILEKCNIPLTAEKAVTTIVTEKAIIDIDEEGFVLKAYNPVFEIEEIVSEISANVRISEDLYEMDTAV